MKTYHFTGVVSFLFLFLTLLCFPVDAENRCLISSPQDPQPSPLPQRLQTQVSRAVRKRAGVVIWMDLLHHTSSYFGDTNLARQKFLPGSLMKLIVAEAAIEKGIAWHYLCRGRERIGRKIVHCWTSGGHGELKLPQAIAFSCNLFFQTLGLRLGEEAILQTLARYSFSQLAFLNRLRLSPLELSKMAIGDYSKFQVTPDEMAEFWRRYLTHLSQESYAPIRQGLMRAVEEGTASRAFSPGLSMLGKTGTAGSLVKPYKTHGWFLGAFPAQNPQFAFVIFLKDAHGSQDPSRLARKLVYIACGVDLLDDAS